MTLDTMDRIRTGWLLWERDGSYWSTIDALEMKNYKNPELRVLFAEERIFANAIERALYDESDPLHARAIALISEETTDG